MWFGDGSHLSGTEGAERNALYMPYGRVQRPVWLPVVVPVAGRHRASRSPALWLTYRPTHAFLVVRPRSAHQLTASAPWANGPGT